MTDREDPPIPDYILEDRLREWARWARMGRRPEHCMSMEWQWNSAMWNGWRDKVVRHEISQNKAIQIEEIVCYIGCQDQRARNMLVFHYVFMANPRATVRRLKINIMDYDVVLWSARGRVAACLQFIEESRISHSYRESERCAGRQAPVSEEKID